MEHKVKIIILVISLLVASCGGGDSSNNPVVSTGDNNNTIVLKGRFIDTVVIGLAYKTVSRSGFTNILGEYEYSPGESITFSIGDIKFNSVGAATFISPLDIYNTTDTTNTAVVNLAQFLQSLDVDGNTANGITISDLTHNLATGAGLAFDFNDPNFDSLVANFIANSAAANGGSATSVLVTEAEAITHLDTSLLDFDVASECKSTHAKVGFTGTLSQISHDVSGRLTIIDDCTILVTVFSYDGGGPEVYFYAGTDGQYDPRPINSTSFRVSGKITGTVSTNAQMLLKIPTGKTLDDFNGISVWCEFVSSSFGDTLLQKAN